MKAKNTVDDLEYQKNDFIECFGEEIKNEQKKNQTNKKLFFNLFILTDKLSLPTTLNEFNIKNTRIRK